MTIIVNGEEKDFSGETHIDYEDVVLLAGKSGSPTVTYRGPKTGDSRREGIMHPGCEPVMLVERMVFNVVHTDKA